MSDTLALFQSTPRPKRDPLRPYPEDLASQTVKHEIPSGEEAVIPIELVAGFVDIDVHVAEGANATVVLQTKNPVDFSRVQLHGMLKKDAKLHVVSAVTGGSRIEIESWIELRESGSEAMVSGMFIGTGEEHQGMHVLMEHLAPSTKGDIFIRGVYREKSRGIFTGLIRIAKDAQQTNSYFKDDVLLFDDALAESLPTLEILANDVKASHGSTTGRINDEQLFYLMSRGLSKEQANEMMIEGFLEKVRERLPKSVRA